MIQGNNPGNIRCSSANNWQGQTGCAGGFVVFSSLFYGFRAMFKILLNDINAGKDTIEQLIYEYAPPVENNTEQYITNVCAWSGIPRTASLRNWPGAIMALAAAMTRMETGTTIDSADLYDAYMAAAGSSPPPEPYAEQQRTFPLVPALVALYLFT